MNELAAELNRLAQRVNDERVHKKALEAGAAPVVNRARAIMRQYRRTGKLDAGLKAEYVSAAVCRRSRRGTQRRQYENTGFIEIGYGEYGFYGKFHDRGFKPRGWSVQFRRPHIWPAYEAEKAAVAAAMIGVLETEL